MEIYIWLGIAIISVLVEISTAGLAAIWFAPAALLSMLLAIFNVPVSVQIPVFIIVSGLLMLIFYKKIKENIEKVSEKTNIDALIGKEGVAEEDILPRSIGRVKVGGISWAAYIRNDSLPVKKGEFVKIIAIDGVKLEVEKIETKAEVLSNEYICDK
ncbi:MAG: NfeD family protein [Clostridia bacterium]|nr:NfeD family protein [Clostridia bacterium]